MDRPDDHTDDEAETKLNIVNLAKGREDPLADGADCRSPGRGRPGDWNRLKDEVEIEIRQVDQKGFLLRKKTIVMPQLVAWREAHSPEGAAAGHKSRMGKVESCESAPFHPNSSREATFSPGRRARAFLDLRVEGGPVAFGRRPR